MIEFKLKINFGFDLLLLDLLRLLHIVDMFKIWIHVRVRHAHKMQKFSILHQCSINLVCNSYLTIALYNGIQDKEQGTTK